MELFGIPVVESEAVDGAILVTRKQLESIDFDEMYRMVNRAMADAQREQAEELMIAQGVRLQDRFKG